MPQLTRIDKYRRYRDQITKMTFDDDIRSTDENLSSPNNAETPKTEPEIRRTTNIALADIIKATQEIPGQPELDDDQLDKLQNRRFIFKVALICLLVVIVIIVGVIWIVNGGRP